MPHLKTTRVLPYTCDQLFDIVLDVESYPQFLPWCLGAHINEPATLHPVGTMRATLEIGYKDVKSVYTSDIQYARPSEIIVTQAEGPLERLYNRWQFVPTPRGCRLHFEIEFLFKAGLFNAMIQPIFRQAAETMVASFEQRARQIISANH